MRSYPHVTTCFHNLSFLQLVSQVPVIQDVGGEERSFSDAFGSQTCESHERWALVVRRREAVAGPEKIFIPFLFELDHFVPGLSNFPLWVRICLVKATSEAGLIQAMDMIGLRNALQLVLPGN